MAGPDVSASSANDKPAEPAHRQPALPQRRPPPMRIVTKGWWRFEEGQADIASLVKQDRDEEG